MNEHPESASAWMGRILIETFAEDVKYPVMKIRNLTDPALYK